MNYFRNQQENEHKRCEGIIHEIKKGDTLYILSRLYKINLEELILKNQNIDVYNLNIGDKLCIPVKNIPYIIKKGDTLDWILEHFGIDYESFRLANTQMSPIYMKENEIVYIPD